MSGGSSASSGIQRRAPRTSGILAVAALGFCSIAHAQFYNIADLGAQFGAPISMEGGSSSMLIPDATTGQLYGLFPPVSDRSGIFSYPVATPLNQLTNAPAFGPSSAYTSTTVTNPMVFDGGSSQSPDSDSFRIGGTFIATDGTSHLFEFFNPTFDGNSPPTISGQTGFQDFGSVPGHANDTLVVTSIDLDNNIVGYAAGANGVKTPFIKRIGNSPLQVLTGTPIQEPTGVENARIVGNTVVTTSNGPVSHGYFNSTDVGTLGGTGTHISGIGEDFYIAGTSQTAAGFDHAFTAPAVGSFGNEHAGTLIDLGTLGGQTSFANAIQPQSLGAPEVVGAAQTASGAFHAFVDMGGGPMIDLNNLLSPADQANWVLTNATTVSEDGNIAGVGLYNGVQHAFFITTEPLLQPPQPPVSVQTDAPTKVIQSTPGAQVIVLFNTTVTVGNSAPQPLFAPYNLTPSGTPAPRFVFGNGHFSPTGFLTTVGQSDSFNYELDLTDVTGPNYTGGVTFSALGSGLSDVTADVNIQILDPAFVFTAGQIDPNGNQTGVFVFAAAAGSRAIPDAEITGQVTTSPGWSQVGTTFTDGAKIPANGNLSATFAFNDPHAANGIHYGVVSFQTQNDHTVLGASAIAPQEQFELLSFDLENPALPKGSPYTGLSNTSPFGDQTTATLLDGAVGDNTSAVIPGDGKPTINIVGNSGANPSLDSDIITLSGTNGDIVVLQLSFVNLTNDTNPADFALMYDPTNGSFSIGDATELAVDANTGPNSILFFPAAYDPSTDFHLGYYGVDLANGVAWAVIDHNSQFAVETLSVPEPAAATSLLIIASLHTLRRRRLS